MKQDQNNKNRSEPLGLIGESLNESDGRRLCLPLVVVGVLATLILWASGVRAAEFIPLGDLSGGEYESSARGISADGTVVVGISSSDFDGKAVDGGSEAFRWTAETGMVGLGDFPGGFFRSRAWAVSADGSVVVGRSGSSVWDSLNDGWGSEAFRWTAETGMVGLGDFSGGFFNSSAGAVSADGGVVVGGGAKNGPSVEAFRWTSAGGLVGLGGYESKARDVSANGSVVVGRSREAFRWTSAGGLVSLGFLPGGDKSEALGVSTDGNVVVGRQPA